MCKYHIPTIGDHLHIYTFAHLHISHITMHYITHIQRAPSRHMSVITTSPDTLQAHQDSLIPWADLCTIGLASLETTDEITNGIRIYTTKLTFAPPQPLPPDSEPHAYRLTLTDGTHLLLGLQQPPHPLRTTTNTREDKPTGKSTITHTITWTSTHQPMQLF